MTHTENQDVYALLGYKSAEYYIITLGIPHESKTNLNRKVFDDRYALFNTNCAVVLRIEHKDDPSKTLLSIKPSYYDKNVNEYKVNTIISLNDCIIDDRDCGDGNWGEGIWFYKTREAAYYPYYNNNVIAVNFLPKPGEFHDKCWDNNGRLISEKTYINGENVTHKSYDYYKNSNKLESEYTFKSGNGNFNGPCKRYYRCGKLYVDYLYTNGKKDGICKGYYDNGHLADECLYVDGKEEGIQKIYYKNNGKLRIERFFINGTLHGLCRRYENDKLVEEYTYVNGIIQGLYKKYDEKGQIIEEHIYINGEIDRCRKYDKNSKLVEEYIYVDGKKKYTYLNYVNDKMCV